MTENKETTNTNASSPEEKIVIIEKNIHRTNLRRFLDTLCLCVPIALAFAGCFLATPLWNLIKKNNEVPQIFRFACATIFFALAVIFVFIKTRKINPIMKIGIFSNKDNSVENEA